MILVGDSMGNVIHGYGNTIPVTLDEICRPASPSNAAPRRAMVVADMPFGTYHKRGRKRPECTAADEIRRCRGRQARGRTQPRPIWSNASSNEEIPVVAHIGLTPQSVYKMGGYRVQGRRPNRRNS